MRKLKGESEPGAPHKKRGGGGGEGGKGHTLLAASQPATAPPMLCPSRTVAVLAGPSRISPVTARQIDAASCTLLQFLFSPNPPLPFSSNCHAPHAQAANRKAHSLLHAGALVELE